MEKTRQELEKMSIKQLKNHLEQTRSMNYSAALTYGSELCAGSMEREEREIEEVLKKKINTK